MNVSGVLITKATASLDEEIRKELEEKDPSPEKAVSFLEELRETTK